MELPSVETFTLEDGCVRVEVGDQSGVVSSFHLVEPKANQLKDAWIRAHLMQNAELGADAV
jgi:hypothetical protein